MLEDEVPLLGHLAVPFAVHSLDIICVEVEIEVVCDGGWSTTKDVGRRKARGGDSRCRSERQAHRAWLSLWPQDVELVRTEPFEASAGRASRSDGNAAWLHLPPTLLLALRLLTAMLRVRPLISMLSGGRPHGHSLAIALLSSFILVLLAVEALQLYL